MKLILLLYFCQGLNEIFGKIILRSGDLQFAVYVETPHLLFMAEDNIIRGYFDPGQ